MHSLSQLKFKITPYINKVLPFYTPGIRSICICITLKCNLRCKMCGAWGEKGICINNPNFFSEDLEEKTFKELIDDLSEYKTHIILSGGEPLLHKNWYEFAKYVKSKNMALVIQTNGMFLSNNVSKIMEVADQINVSLDGIREVHNKIRSDDTSYDKIISGLKKLQELKIHQKTNTPGVAVWFTITPWNYRYLKETLDTLSDLKIGMNFISFMYPMFINNQSYEDYKNRVSNKFNIGDVLPGFLFEFENFDITYLVSQISDIKKNKFKYKGLNIIFSPELNNMEIEKYYDNSVNLTNSRIRCLTPWFDAFLFPFGDLYSCCGILLGNIKKEGIKEIWNNNLSREFRKTLIKEGSLPICKNCCFRRSL